MSVVYDGTILDGAENWLTEGRTVALATVVETWGSAPCPVGSHLIISEDGAFEGSVSGGCIEGAVISEAGEVLASGKPRLLEFGVSNEDAWEVGLACGGNIRVFVESLNAKLALIRMLQNHRRRRNAAAVVTDLENGDKSLVTADGQLGDLSLTDENYGAVLKTLSENESGFAEGLFVRTYTPPWTIIVIGAVHITKALIPMAELAGFDVLVIDPRQAFASEGRFPGNQVITDWPDKALSEFPLDDHCAVVTLSHDPKIDDPALSAAVRSRAFYVGALGSRRSHEKRKNRLAEQGAPAGQIDRIKGPVGLDLGGRSAGEIAVSVIAEIVAARHGKRP
ncbi:MAG: XdhC family protein [Rhodospirillales bacterium]|nr:XdhC family protein [Rhodospirillales bacterium]